MLTTINNKEQQRSGSNKTSQFLHESITWKRLLDFFIQENSFLKTRLSQVVDKETDNEIIAGAEQFQNEFILKDECILDIWNDINGQEKHLQLAFTQQRGPDIKTGKKQEKLRNEMSNLERECLNLKTRFNKYLLSIV